MVFSMIENRSETQIKEGEGKGTDPSGRAVYGRSLTGIVGSNPA
jgi:hypothetical protein